MSSIKRFSFCKIKNYCKIYIILALFCTRHTNSDSNPETLPWHDTDYSEADNFIIPSKPRNIVPPVSNLNRLATYFGPCPHPLNFPKGIPLSSGIFQSYARDIKVPSILTATPRNSNDVLQIVNWAYQSSYRVRAVGGRHNFSPLLVSPTDPGVTCPKIILVDTTVHLTSLKTNPLDAYNQSSVTVGSGVKLLALLTFLEEHDLGIFASPSIGGITVGGMLATGVHGSGVSGGSLDKKEEGYTSGTLSNLVVSMTIVAWDNKSKSYILKDIHRSHKDCKAFLVNLGRTFVISVILRVGKNQNLRTQSHFYVPKSEFYAKPGSKGGQTLSNFVSEYGRVDGVSFPRGKFVWVLTWHEESLQPSFSRKVLFPFNFFFMNYVPKIVERAYQFLLTTIPPVMKVVSPFTYIGSYLGTFFTLSRDIWGPSKNHLVYISPYTPHLAISAFAVITSRSNVQMVASIMMSHYDDLEAEYASQLLYPVTGGLDFRVSGVDDPKDVGIVGAESPSLSAARIDEEHPGYDTVIWFDIGSFLGTPKRGEFMERLQSLLYKDVHDKGIGMIRAEWSKEWAFRRDKPFQNWDLIRKYFTNVYSKKEGDGWNWTIKTLNRYDPYRVFSNDFLDKLLYI